MARLKLLVLAAALAAATPAAADPLDRWQDYIAEASARFGIPEAWIRRVMRAESGGRTTLAGRPIVSRAGAQGLMQVMPETWRGLRAAHGLGADPHDPRENILAGTAYLRAMYDRFGYPGLFAAYNAGPARYAEHLSRGRRLPSETVAYVAQIAGDARASRPLARPVALASAGHDRQSLFAMRAERQPQSDAAQTAPDRAAPSLFFALRGADRP
ncbi:MAG TPA: lytic transglycosylase domain-containing protein [Sphingomicrobium sp.]|jgi:soluble lytic murein transglycosylase-like protein|nr:lytic transglycosylase domain-containing protein [Sphingomicrobium sp.]